MTVFWLLLIVVMLAGIYLYQYFSGRSWQSQGSVELSASSSEEFVQRLSLSVAPLSNHQISAVSPDSVVITHQMIPVWVLVVAVLFFPIGLVALLVRRSITVSVVVQEIDGGHLRVRYQGRGCKKLWKQLSEVLTTMQEEQWQQH